MVLDYDEHEQNRGTHSTEWARCYGEAEPAHSGIDMVSQLSEGARSDPRLPWELTLGILTSLASQH